jgi:hypothetical protein
MRKKDIVLRSMLSVGLLFGSLVYAQSAHKPMKPPADNISAKSHPNLAAAQRLCDQAFQKISAGQQANEFDVEGHAAKAKELLDQASQQLHQAAVAANKEHKSTTPQ